jgi:GNAT superfamily N-acetyltransferase
MELRKMSLQDAGFVYECLQELRGEAAYTLAEFIEFIGREGVIDHAQWQILIGSTGVADVGMLTCNRLAVPRYIGVAYEIEELVVHPTYQGKGYGTAMVACFVELAKRDPAVRKVLVKTDDDLRAARIYSRFFERSEASVFARRVHVI